MIAARGIALLRAWPRAVALLVLACLLAQGTAIQTHVHFIPQARVATAASGGQLVQAPQPGKGDSPADCPLCQEAAMAGAYLTPRAIVLPPPPAPVLLATIPAIAAFSLIAPPRGWRSRAPPR